MLRTLVRAMMLAFLCTAATLDAGEAYRHPEPVDLKPGVTLYRSLDNDGYELIGTVTAIKETDVFWQDSEGKGEKSASIKEVAKYWFVAADKASAGLKRRQSEGITLPGDGTPGRDESLNG